MTVEVKCNYDCGNCQHGITNMLGGYAENGWINYFTCRVLDKTIEKHYDNDGNLIQVR